MPRQTPELRRARVAGSPAPRLTMRGAAAAVVAAPKPRAAAAQEPPIPPRPGNEAKPPTPRVQVPPFHTELNAVSPLSSPTLPARGTALQWGELSSQETEEPGKAECQRELLSLLECSVCLEPMEGPIELCCNGHSVCATCRSTLPRCPECRGAWAGARCRRLEAIAERFGTKPCRHAGRGCEQRLPGREMERHEAGCPWRPVKCMVCGKAVPMQELLSHVGADHKGNVSVNGMSRTVHNTLPNKYSFYLVEESARLFWLWRRHSPQFVCLGVDALCEPDPGKHFRVDIEVERADKQCVLVWAGPTHAAREHEERSAFTPCHKCLMATGGLMKQGTRYTVNIRAAEGRGDF